MYPEYMTDIMTYLCPSDGEAHSGKVTSQDFISVAGSDVPIDGVTSVPHPADGQEFTRLFAHSYIYQGYAMTWNQADPGLEAGTGTILGQLGTGQFGFAAIVSGYAAALSGGASHPEWIGWEQGAHLQDIDDVYFEDGTQGTVHRFKEGIERFFITDINNPSGSATAQSTLEVMWDTATQYSPALAAFLISVGGDPADYTPSLIAGEFNHLPGGINVLFMDGHVTFVKYPSDEIWSLSKQAMDAGVY